MTKLVPEYDAYLASRSSRQNVVSSKVLLFENSKIDKSVNKVRFLLQIVAKSLLLETTVNRYGVLLTSIKMIDNMLEDDHRDVSWGYRAVVLIGDPNKTLVCLDLLLQR